jgi:hypothetical protein
MSASTDITTHARIRDIRIDWTPYLTGAGIGVLSRLAFAVADDPLGVTRAPIAAYRPLRLPDLSGIADLAWLGSIVDVGFAVLFVLGGRRGA